MDLHNRYVIIEKDEWKTIWRLWASNSKSSKAGQNGGRRMQWKRMLQYGLMIAAVVFLSMAGTRQAGAVEAEELPAVSWIREQEQKDVNAIEDKLDAREHTEETGSTGEGKSLQERMQAVVLVGDSVTEGFLDYEILEADKVVARKGMRADTAGEDIQKALSLSPSLLILSMGLNDLEYCKGDSARFIQAYEERIQEIRNQDPTLLVCVNGILPVLPQAVAKKEALGHVEEFNKALQEMCERLDLIYIESGDLLEGKEEWYQKDAIHLKYDFYPLWLARIEEVAGR